MKIHWGSGFSALDARLHLAARSPMYETLEYLESHINYWDILIVLYNFIVIFFLFRFIKYYKHDYKILKGIGILTAIMLIFVLGQKQPLVLIQNYIHMLNDTHIYTERAKYLSSLVKNKNISKIISSSYDYDKIVIIQGESVNKHHMGIYGYPVNTTPYFSELMISNKFYKFNVIAPSNLTKYAVPMLLTKAHVSDWENMFIHSQSIVSDFTGNNYITHWVSNQGKSSRADDYIANIAYEANSTVFFNEWSWEDAKTDMVIKKYLDVKKSNHDKEMYVFHLMGSHFSYKKRVENHILYKHPKGIIEEYDNTIYFTDYIIKQIFQYFLKDSEKVLIVYFSDHGEVVNAYKDGHGLLPTYKDEYEIPLLVYSSIDNPRIIKLLEKNKTKFFNAENMNYFIEYISGISDDANISYSSQIFAIDPKNIRDYNQLKFYGEDEK